jgi:pimeloyl-ACP methyl ester carboxylesterase
VQGARLVEVSGAGHLLNLDRPEAFGEVLLTAVRAATGPRPG